ncbi:hypothetical protein JI739_03170 [Ramlibacter sp. AW1]|uniref:Protein kinase domain-containing protein n=1 Tax=Ramlibacter aurantiacus TaxID=2801330 RepID=A0A936ZKE4_9BURK|nr:hypothetical protein [Ramlibacter aurantiacus]MBL0419341.1 hypothetical protein [Ramlibacter aurantiacus]
MEQQATPPDDVPADHAEGLRHPNIADASLSQGAETLAQHLARTGRLPAMKGMALSAELLSALDFAHAQGRVHGGIDLQHLLVSRSGRLQVIGFDRPVAAGPAPSAAQEAPPHLAPEQVLGLPVDHRADLYAAAVVIYELLTGVPPFPGVPQRILGAPALPAQAARPELPPAVNTVLQRALSSNPEARFQRAAEFSAALQSALGRPLWAGSSEPVAAPVAAASAASAVATPRLQRFETAVAAACLATIAYLASLATAPPTVPRVAPGWSYLEARPTPPGAAAVIPARESIAAGEEVIVLGASPPPSEPLAASTPQPPSAPQPVADQPPDAPAGPAAPRQPVGAEPAPSARASPSPQPAIVRAAAPRSADGASPAPAPARRAIRRPQPAWVELGCRQGNSLARDMCTVFRCATAEFRRHPICVRMHAEQQRVRDRMALSQGGP